MYILSEQVERYLQLLVKLNDEKTISKTTMDTCAKLKVKK